MIKTSVDQLYPKGLFKHRTYIVHVVALSVETTILSQAIFEKIYWIHNDVKNRDSSNKNRQVITVLQIRETKRIVSFKRRKYSRYQG